MRVVLICGFLGSGKTTMLLALAREAVDVHGMKVAVIENEAGRTGVDDQYLAHKGLNVRELFGGCVCCTLGPSLLSSLQEIHQQVGPDLLLIEPSGVAGPLVLRDLLRQVEAARDTRVLGMIDAQRYTRLREVMPGVIDQTLEAADLAIINKIDQVSGQAVTAIVHEVQATRPQLPLLTLEARHEPRIAAIWPLLLSSKNPTPRPLTRLNVLPSPVVHDHHHDHGHDGPRAEARRMELAWPAPVTQATLTQVLTDMLKRLADNIAAHQGSLIGHLKCAVVSDAGFVLLRTTTAEALVHVDGQLARPVDRAVVTLNAICCGLDEKQLAQAVDQAVGDLPVDDAAAGD